MSTSKEKTQALSANLFPVVGIGASAGGLEAFKKLLKAIPENSGIAYVLVQHLDPDHESLLPGLLQKVTSIPVVEISNDLEVEPDHIYIIPSNKMLVAYDGVLKLSPRKSKDEKIVNLPIDLFFTSLAEVHQAHAIGVVLSGIASDGTQGLKAIKDHGGITIAQDEESASYSGMPLSARQAGVVDFILPPEKIPGKLIEIKKHFHHSDEELQSLPSQEEEIFKQILSALRIRKGTDFTFYKQTTIRRRILRRIALSKSETLHDYLIFLRHNTTEQDSLYQDLLIPVTSFFRDHKVFDDLCETVFPKFLERRENDIPVRIWVAGCSTGQEVYSIAICLKEFLRDTQEKVQIFATDISAPAVEKARTGIYSKNEMGGISPERLNEFFTRVNGNYHITRQVRDMCVFAVHNFLKDPPFGKMDLISCRNVLIYMEPYLQKKALATFHYALNEKGLLLLGKSETAGNVPGLFRFAVKSDKLYSRINGNGRFAQPQADGMKQDSRIVAVNRKGINVPVDLQKTADDIVLDKYTPAAVVVNDNLEIVHFRGNTGVYLEPAPGKPSHNLLKMAKGGLAFELRAIMHKARKAKAPILKNNVAFQSNDKKHLISIEVIPLTSADDAHYLVLFHDGAPVTKKAAKKNQKTSPASRKDKTGRKIKELEEDLAQTRESVRGIIEDQEAANEELQSANEELISSSEELQSLNEELETSKEELQTTNEELLVVNQELVGLNQQVTQARDYAEAIVTTVRTPLLILDQHLRVTSANSSFYKFFQTSEFETDGNLIYDLGNKQWDIPALRKLLEELLPKKTSFTDFEMTHNFPIIGERVVLLNAREILLKNKEEKLILLAIEDITEETRLKNEEREFQKELEKKIEERTIELRFANDKLKQKNSEVALNNEVLGSQNRDLVLLNKELESFNYISSHDLQEPLRKIQTFANLLLKKEVSALTDKGKDYFNRIQNAAIRMQTLIDDLLAYSKASIIDRKLDDVHLNEIIELVKNDLAETIREKKAIIEADRLCPARVDPSQFRQVMNNLLANALKFSKPGLPPHIIIKSKIAVGTELKAEKPSLTTEKVLPYGHYCHISVSDNGIGFDQKYKEQIFDVFQRLYTKEEYPGTGIGLAIVRKIVNNHGGFVTATSELNKGATFDIYLPHDKQDSP